MDPILHICSQEAWQAAQTAGAYRAESLQLEGFIHCSRPEQILATANRYFAGSSGNLLVLWIDPSKLMTKLRWEHSEGEVYPHLYGALNLEAVLGSAPLRPDDDGVFRALPKLS